MAVKHSRVTVTTTAAAVSTQTDDPRADFSATLRNAGTASIFIGGSTVTAANGFELPAGASLSVDFRAGDVLHAIVASGTQRLDIIWSGVAA